MKNPTRTVRSSVFGRAGGGFSLVVVLSMLVLLLVLAVGLLTLSGVTLRASAQGQAVAEARANARLALVMALGDLQEHAGPDTRVTARADILEAGVSNPRITGVWDSWEVDVERPPSSADYDGKDEKFRSWLVSSTDPDAVVRQDFAKAFPEDPVTLMGEGSLGPDAPVTDHVSAARVPLKSSRGALAWAVLDEGVKARLNMSFRNEAASVGEKSAQLGTGIRPAAEMIQGLDLFKRSQFERGSVEFTALEKGITRSNFGMAGESFAPGLREALMPLAHDFTIHSLGLFTDTARGGLKKDFHLLTEGSRLPGIFNGTGVYSSMLGIRVTDAPSEPKWEAFRELATLHRNGIVNSGGSPTLRSRWPSSWQAATLSTSPRKVTVTRRTPTGAVMLPTIAKVQMLFSLVGRDIYDYAGPSGAPVPDSAPTIHFPQGDHFRGTQYKYDLHLLYTPIVTLHNPYNVALEFNKMRIEFANVPFAATVFRNGVAQARSLVPFERMWADNEGGQTSKIFGMNLKTKTAGGTPGTTTFRLLPGETKLFSPYIDPNRTWRQDLGDRKFWDIYVGTGITNNIDAIPGWRGDGIGFDLDWWAPANARINGEKTQGRWEGCLGLSRDDQIHIEFAPLSEPAVSSNRFSILMSASPTASGRETITSAIEIDYQAPDGLQRFLLGRGNTLRYPKEGTVLGIDLVDHSSTPIKNLARTKPFALMTVQAKTTSGGRDADAGDGRFGTKPWAFAHAVAAASTQKIQTEHPANHSHEIDLQRLDNGTANVLQIDTMDRANFVTGHTAFNGSKFGAMYEVPVHPVQSLSTLNGANPGGGSSYLPRFAQPIGNSWAHPLMNSGRVVETRAEGTLLDHSFLLNQALYDGFYFSGLAAQTGPFGSGRTGVQLAEEFVAGESLDDPRMVLHRPDGRAAEDFSGVVGNAETGYAEVAAWQLMQGPFNINSTSVSAWKAMLGSIHDAQSVYSKIDTVRGTVKVSELPGVDDGKARSSRFRPPAMISDPGDDESPDRYWLGQRELTDDELQILAERIVEQVRQRGPFLSMAEFVNRQLGNGEKALKGALQQAIDESNLNARLALATNAGFEIPLGAVAEYKYATPAAGSGPSYQGAPGFLTQADLLSVLGNAATARSDTFTIRGYGEARDARGKVVATAWCEASVQRLPEWVDEEDLAEVGPEELKSEANRRFGRRFHVLSFRWLSPGEV